MPGRPGMQQAGGFRPGQNPNGYGAAGSGMPGGGMPGSNGMPGGSLRGQTGPGTARKGSGFFLSLFGDRISIPPEGAWIGREGLGKEWFDGNLMVSRKHVYVRPNPQTGRLQVNEDKSLNGVFHTGKDGRKTRLNGARMMEPGDILWIYNVPLRIET